MPAAGYKLFVTGDVLTAAQVNDYLMLQTVMVFANSAARTSALSGVLAEGLVSYLKDTDVVEIYTGAAWVSLDDPNAIQNSIVDAKGDLITATADNTPARLAVGTNGQTLVADSAEATGLKWATPAATGFVGVSLCKSADQSISNTTLTAVTFNTELFDTDGFHDNSTNNSRITIPAGKAGKYLFTAKAMWLVNSGGGIRFIQLTKNGTDITGDNNVTPNANFGVTSQVNQVFNLAVSDYIEAKIYQDSGGALSVASSASGLATVIQATYLGA